MYKFLSLSLFFLASCATQVNDSEFTSGIPVNSKDLDKYWIIETSKQPWFPPGHVIEGKIACVNIVFVIGSDGNVYNPRLLYKPGPVHEDFVSESLKAIRKFSYTPSTENSERKPIITTNTFLFGAFDKSAPKDRQSALFDKLSKACAVDIEKDYEKRT